MSEGNNMDTGTKPVTGVERVYEHIRDGDFILVVGAKYGAVVSMILDRFPQCKVIAQESREKYADALDFLRKEYPGRVCAISTEYFDLPATKFDVILFWESMRDLFSNTMYEGARYNRNLIYDAVKRAGRLLKPQGRVIINDGVGYRRNPLVTLKYLTEESENTAREYKEKFEGFDLQVRRTQFGDTMPLSSALEVLHAVVESESDLPRPVWHGFYSIDDWKEMEPLFFNVCRIQLVKLEKYLDERFARTVKGKVVLFGKVRPVNDGEWNPRGYKLPASHCLVVFQKTI